MSDDTNDYVDTPRGIFHASGTWFHVTEEKLNEYAGEVFRHQSLEELLAQAATWLRSSQTVTIWGILAALLLLPPAGAVGAILLLYAGWESVGPSLVNRPMIHLFGVLERPLVQMAGYILALSYLAQQEAFWAVGIGLAGFILLRWNVLNLILRPLVMRLRRSLYEMPVADHVLRLVIIRAALKYNVSLPDLQQLEAHVWRTLRRFDRDGRN